MEKNLNIYFTWSYFIQILKEYKLKLFYLIEFMCKYIFFPLYSSFYNEILILIKQNFNGYFFYLDFSLYINLYIKRLYLCYGFCNFDIVFKIIFNIFNLNSSFYNWNINIYLYFNRIHSFLFYDIECEKFLFLKNYNFLLDLPFFYIVSGKSSFIQNELEKKELKNTKPIMSGSQWCTRSNSDLYTKIKHKQISFKKLTIQQQDWFLRSYLLEKNVSTNDPESLKLIGEYKNIRKGRPRKKLVSLPKIEI